MLTLQELIKKFPVLNNFLSITPSSNLKDVFKAFFSANTFLKTLNKINLSYFDLQLHKAYNKDEMVLLDKKMSYKNIMLFMQCFQSFVTFCDAALIKINITTLLLIFFFEMVYLSA